MPTTTVTGPDGKDYTVTHPEGATDQQILNYAKENYGPLVTTESAPVVDPREGLPPQPPGSPDPVYIDPATKPNKPVEGKKRNIAQSVYNEWIEPFNPFRGYKSAARKKHVQSRSWPETAGQTLAFMGSLPVRMATAGKHGLGSVPGLKFIGDAEKNFMQANEPQLRALGSMGMSSAFLGTPQWLSLGRMYMPPAKVPGAGRVKIPKDQLDNKAVLGDITRRINLPQAFQEHGVPPYLPGMLPEGGLKSAVSAWQGLPVVGQPFIKSAQRTLDGIANAADRLAMRYGVGGRDFGEQVAQRLRDYRFHRLPAEADQMYGRAFSLIPDDIRLGASNADVDARLLIGATDTAQTIRSIIDRNLRSAGREGLGRNPKGRFKIPSDEMLKAPSGLPVSGGYVGDALGRLATGQYRSTLQGIRDLRSQIRRMTSGMRDTEKNALSNSDVARIQSSLTADADRMLRGAADAYDDIARRGKPYPIKGMRRGGDYSARATDLRVAANRLQASDSHYRTGKQALDTVEAYWQEGKTGAQVQGQLMRDAAQKTANIERLRTLPRIVGEEGMGDLANGVIHRLGRPQNSARGMQDASNWSTSTFMTEWRKLHPDAKDIIFGRRGSELRDSLESLVDVTRSVANFESAANSSRTATHLLATAVLGGGAVSLGANPFTTLMYGGGTWLMAHLMTRPQAVRILARGLQIERSGEFVTPVRRQLVRQTFAQLSELVRRDPELTSILSRASMHMDDDEE